MYGRLGSLAFLHLTEANAQRHRLAETSHAAEAGKGTDSRCPSDGAWPVAQVAVAVGVALAIITALAVAVE